MNAAVKFFSYYNLPYFGSHLIADNDHTWLHRKSRLSYSKIEKALFNDIEVSYFASSYTRSVSIDIDDHISLSAWENDRPTNYLKTKYNKTVKAMNVIPSLVVRTPRGLHLTWFFEDISPTLTINRVTKDMVKGIGVEVKPTMSTGLRITNTNKILDPKSLLPTITKLEHSAVYKRIEIYDFRYSVTAKEQRKTRKYANMGIYRAEAHILKTLANGCTNTQLCYMAGSYRANGATLEEAVGRFRNLLNSIDYTGDLLHGNNLLNRMKSLYEGSGFIRYNKRDNTQDYQKIIDRIIEIAKNHIGVRSIKPLIKLVTAILEYTDKQSIIYNNNESKAAYNEQYQFFNWNMKHDFTPLPVDVFLSANAKYWKYIPLLKAMGFLTESDMHYSVGNYCKSFYVEKDPEYLHEYLDAVQEANMVDFHNNIIKARTK